MAKTKTKSKAKKTKNVTISRVKAGLDRAAIDYAKLLVDPCNAALTTPVYAGIDSGYLMRIRYRFPIGTNTYFAVNIMPNVILDKSAMIITASTGGTGLSGFVDATNGNYAIAMDNIARSYRCVAACAKVMYTGTEANRSGLIGLATSAERTLLAGVNYTPGTLMSKCPYVTRCGTEPHEVKWAPSTEDQMFINTGDTPSGNGSAMLIVGEGTGANSITIEFTGVYEWLPSAGNGVTTTYSPPKSNNTLNDVLKALGPATNWTYTYVKDKVIQATPVVGRAMM